MARERVKNKRKGGDEKDETEKLSKLQMKVVNWVRKNVPTKKTKFEHSHVVEYFSAAKALDALMKDSPWAPEKAKEGSELRFEFREQAIDYMGELLRQHMFHRARKVAVAEKEKKKKKEETEDEEPEKPTKKSKKDEKKEREKEKEKKKRKIRLEMHYDQVFLDGNDAYVWLYDPTPWYYYIAGTAIVLGIIAVCLFPLWPMEMRQGVYYLSVAAAGFLVFIIVLAIVKYIIFVILFIGTRGKLKFWIFPNLTEDVGFFESFVPAYVYTYDKPKKAKDSDDEESSEEEDDDEDEKEDGGREGDGEGSETGKDDQENSDDNSKSSDGAKDFEFVSKE